MKCIKRMLIAMMILAVLIALPLKVTVAQDIGGRYVGAQAGTAIQADKDVAFVWSVIGNLSTSNIPGVRHFMTKVEASFLNADRPYDSIPEMNVFRLFSVRQFRLSENWYCGVGGGYWHTINTDGDDPGDFAVRGELGWKTFEIDGGNLELHLAAEAVRRAKADIYVIQLGIMIY